MIYAGDRTCLDIPEQWTILLTRYSAYVFTFITCNILWQIPGIYRSKFKNGQNAILEQEKKA